MPDPHKLETFRALLARHAVEEKLQETSIPDVFCYKSTKPEQKRTETFIAALFFVASGKKICQLNRERYDYSAGRYLSIFLPMPVLAEACDVDPDDPIYLLAIKPDLNKIADIVLKLDKLNSLIGKSSKPSPAIHTAVMSDALLDSLIRLLSILDNEAEKVVLYGGIMDEIYFRILSEDQTGSVRNLLKHQGKLQQISRAVSHINTNIHEPIVVEDLANLANMSVSGFHKSFKEIMKMTPLHYAKTMKLLRAQNLIKSGEAILQAAYAVGYNSPSQFGREYKREFGYLPSKTR